MPLYPWMQSLFLETGTDQAHTQTSLRNKCVKTMMHVLPQLKHWERMQTSTLPTTELI